ncbi:MAG: hypothetical protein PHF84_09930 [bacterium]|nr:hypothetical protein [bacterium]
MNLVIRKRSRVFFILVACAFFTQILQADMKNDTLDIPFFSIGIEELKPGFFIDFSRARAANPSPVFDGLTREQLVRTERMKNPLEEYIKRIQFITLDNTVKQLCRQNIERLRNDKLFRSRNKISGTEDLSFYAGLYYYGYWTPVSIGKRRTDDAIINHGAGSAGFELPYQSIYSAEQLFKYYLTQYPKGKYVLAAMFSIARCRIHQKDYEEAYYTYKYAVRVALQDYEWDTEEIADTIALELVKYNKRYGENLDIQLQVASVPGMKKNSDYEITLDDRIIRIKLRKRL